jgi:hypothetical protein
MPAVVYKKGVARIEPFPLNVRARSLRWRGRLIDPVKENPNNKMLKKYTKYVATAFAVASLSTFMIGCGGDEETEPLEEQPSAPAEPPLGEGDEGTEGTEGE